MSRPTPHHPKGPSVQVTSSPTPGHLDHLLDSPSSFSSSPASSFASGCVIPSPATVYSENLYPMASQHHAGGGGGSHPGPFVEFVRAHPKGIIRFRPFDVELDATARHAIGKFRVYPAGHIEEFCRHIPYASGKKDFFEKTGRESFEVFQYVFKVPGDDKEYHVMWDYNIGLVRMTPFFKCCKYSKTTPAKMLNLNPGLRDITHSITGGSIMAQGYWMPYSCAKAVCATFCYHIAGALIPIFGPDFPSECLRPQSTDFARMVIDRTLVVEATRETEYMREIYLRSPDDGLVQPSYHQSPAYYTTDATRGTHWHIDLDSRPSSVHRHAALLPLGNLFTRPASVASVEDGPQQLAPLNCAAPRYDPLISSPIEHDRLPPIAQVAALPPVTLPPLFSREGHDQVPYGQTSSSNHQAGSGQSRHRHYLSLSSIGTNEDAQSLAKRPRWDSQLASMSAPDSRPVSRRRETAVLGFPTSRTTPAPPSHHAERRNSIVGHGNQGTDQDRLDSSYCYPSPPRRPYGELYYADAGRSRPLPPSDSAVKDEEASVVRLHSNRATISAGADDAASQQTQPRTTSRRRKVKVRGSGLGSSASAWDALDMDAAELLVNFSVKVKSSKGGDQKCGGDDDSSPGLQAATEGDDRSQPRFNASIASLLCDDEATHRKRRRS